MVAPSKINSMMFAAAALTLGLTSVAAAQDCEGSSADEASCTDVAGVVIEPADGGDTATTDGGDTESAAGDTTEVAAAETLPVTGAETTAMAVTGAALVGGGAALMVTRRRAAAAAVRS